MMTFDRKTAQSAGIALALVLLNSCASQPETNPPTLAKPEKTNLPQSQPRPGMQPIASIGGHYGRQLSGDYAGYPALSQFIDEMAQKHGFQREYLIGLFSQAKRKQWTLDYLHKSDQSLKSKPGVGSWTRYRSQFLDDRHINTGINFWRKHQDSLQRASQQYGVPAEYILGIMAVETTFGGFVGNHRILDALTTLSFDYQRRGDYFRSELENFLLMTRDEGIDPIKPVGSFAGAMGLGQFMPSSFLKWAVDFNGDGRRDLWNADDVIGSIANYFVQHGWQRDQPVVSITHGQVRATAELATGLDSQYTLDGLRQIGLTPADNCPCNGSLRLLQLRHQTGDEYVLGHANFYVITRYNQSTHYAMAVHELAQEIKRGFQS